MAKWSERKVYSIVSIYNSVYLGNWATHSNTWFFCGDFWQLISYIVSAPIIEPLERKIYMSQQYIFCSTWFKRYFRNEQYFYVIYCFNRCPLETLQTRWTPESDTMSTWQGTTALRWKQTGLQIPVWIPLVTISLLILPSAQVQINSDIGEYGEKL